MVKRRLHYCNWKLRNNSANVAAILNPKIKEPKRTCYCHDFCIKPQLFSQPKQCTFRYCSTEHNNEYASRRKQFEDRTFSGYSYPKSTKTSFGRDFDSVSFEEMDESLIKHGEEFKEKKNIYVTQEDADFRKNYTEKSSNKYFENTDALERSSKRLSDADFRKSYADLKSSKTDLEDIGKRNPTGISSNAAFPKSYIEESSKDLEDTDFRKSYIESDLISKKKFSDTDFRKSYADLKSSKTDLENTGKRKGNLSNPDFPHIEESSNIEKDAKSHTRKPSKEAFEEDNLQSNAKKLSKVSSKSSLEVEGDKRHEELGFRPQNPSEKTEKSPSKTLKEFRKSHYFETHSTDSLIEPVPDHICVHKFSCDNRLLPQALNADVYGNSRCTICNKPMLNPAPNPEKRSEKFPKYYKYGLVPRKIFLADSDKVAIDMEMHKKNKCLLAKMPQVNYFNTFALKYQKMMS